ncbi:MAG: four helix bundle protein [Endomicrobia bacterium]|nr:four helix bundle protein [Endomicrobiia bacterium]
MVKTMYRELEIWKESISFIKEIYFISDKFPKSEEYNLKSQIRRASVSVSLNIAEGKCRHSAKDFAHFLNLSSSSLNEVDAILYICEKLNYINNTIAIHNNIKILGKRINSLRNKLLKNIA